MTDKELKKLRRAELLELLAEQTAEADELRRRLRQAEEALAQRELLQQQAGTMAEAAMCINQVFAAADRAAEDYLKGVRGIAREEMAQEKGDFPSPKESEALLL